MPEQSPDTSRRLPNVYTSPDETVGAVGARSLPPQEPARRRPASQTTKFSAVTCVTINEALMRHAMQQTGGDATRLVPRADGSVIIANNREQARRALADLAFGAVNPANTASRVDDLP